jgi:Sec7-like guanine-nucleotide exchange factor
MSKIDSLLASKTELEGKIKRCEERMDALSKRYEWTLSSEEKKSKQRMRSNLDKLVRKLSHVVTMINDDDELTMTTVSSSDTLSTMCSTFEPLPDSYRQTASSMKPLIPPVRNRTSPIPNTTSLDPPGESTAPVSENSHSTRSKNESSSLSTPVISSNSSSNRVNSSKAIDSDKRNTEVNPVSYSFNIPKGLFHGLTLMFFFGVCTKWYISVQQRKLNR